MPVITTIRPTTEVQAVNVMLGAIGEAPLALNADLSALQGTDQNVNMAVYLLTEAVRTLQAEGWRFNTLTGFEIAPTNTYSWVDTAGVTTLLNVFKRPVDVLAWSQTPCSQMSSLELIERMSLKYTEAAAKVMVLFDRVKNRDGADASVVTKLYLDVAFAVDFENMPETARRLATMIAAREMCTRIPSSQSQAQFTEADISSAMRLLKREQGLRKKLNLFQTADSIEIQGRRWSLGGGGYSTKVYPGGA